MSVPGYGTSCTSCWFNSWMYILSVKDIEINIWQKNSKIPTFTLSLLMPREIHSNENTVSFLQRFTIGKSNILSIVKFSGLFAQFLNYHPVIFFYVNPRRHFWMCIETRRIDGAFHNRETWLLRFSEQMYIGRKCVYLYKIFLGKKWWLQTLGTEYK